MGRAGPNFYRITWYYFANVKVISVRQKIITQRGIELKFVLHYWIILYHLSHYYNINHVIRLKQYVWSKRLSVYRRMDGCVKNMFMRLSWVGQWILGWMPRNCKYICIYVCISIIWNINVHVIFSFGTISLQSQLKTTSISAKWVMMATRNAKQQPVSEY